MRSSESCTEFPDGFVRGFASRSDEAKRNLSKFCGSGTQPLGEGAWAWACRVSHVNKNKEDCIGSQNPIESYLLRSV